MPVGKGSIQRAAKAKAAAEKKEEVVEMAVETKAVKEDMEKKEEAKTDMEKKYSVKEPERENRYIFDVAGLWMAILRKNDTEGFYLQLAAAQSGIERHSKLMLSNIKYYNKRLKEYLFSFNEISSNDGFNPEDLDRQKTEEEARFAVTRK